ncbi:MAG: hypothetical protein B6229_03180 [Spirochaetaceae bacterium 4572_7]|nr:MAG: hypothetical protein B6229_03180 [Spirochaetaceae bacterium 4572_7]
MLYRTFIEHLRREYYRCNKCLLITVPKEYHLSPTDEKNRYDQHTNSSADLGYTKFLKRIVNPIIENTQENDMGLDFGCGHSPILKGIFEQQNRFLNEYDIYYRDDKSVFTKKWDFIISTEVAEHLTEPFKVIKQLWNMLKPEGVLGIMTNLYNPDTEFASWYYKGDPTHIQFFSKETMEWIGNNLNATIEIIENDIIILKKI